MNEIKVKRMLLAGFGMFLTWIMASILLEHVIGRLLFGNLAQELLLESTDLSDWSGLNQVGDIFIALLNCTLLIWLYASLRPMYGVGTKTALITSALGVAWLVSMVMNMVNLGMLPAQLGLLEAAFLTIEMPVAMLAGAVVYEEDKR